MNVNGTSVQIMWNEIAIIIFLICFLRCVINVYILVVYNNIYKKFCSYDWVDLDKIIKKHQNICNIFSNGPFNKKVRLNLLIAGNAKMEDFLLVSNMNILTFKNLRNLK